MRNIIFIHGLESSGEGFKGKLFRKILPEILTPTFREYTPDISYEVLLDERMAQLNSILAEKEPWIIIGSSFGGLMGALYALQHPNKVSRLILLAPVLTFPKLNSKKFQPVEIEVTIFLGKKDQVIPLKPTKVRADELFSNLIFNIVDDDHMLHSAVQSIDWENLIKNT